METLIAYPYIVATADTCGGRPRIAGTRISVDQVAEYYRMYKTVELIQEALPHVSPAQIHSALSYYYDHREEIDEFNRLWNDVDFLRSQGVTIWPDNVPGT